MSVGSSILTETTTKVSGLRTWPTEKVVSNTKMEQFIKETGKTTNSTDMVLRLGPTMTDMKATTTSEENMVLAVSSGKTAPVISVNL